MSKFFWTGFRRLLTAVISIGVTFSFSSLAYSVPAHSVPVIDIQRGLQVFQSSGNSNPYLSVSPQVGWDAGLEGARPLSSPLYRLWNSGVGWRDINPLPGVFRWSELDRRIALVESWGGRPMLVLGLTPQWAAADPTAGDPRWGPGTASPPSNINYWRLYVRGLVARYGDRIGAYEVWNEANLRTFFTGTPAEMTEMLKVAHAEIKAGSSSLVLTPSVTTRLPSGGNFARSLITELGDNPEQFFDGFAIHTYPKGSAGATFAEDCHVVTGTLDCLVGVEPRAAALERFEDIRSWQQVIVETVGPDSPVLDKQVWDTEVNYGLAGPGIVPGIDWDDAQGAQLLSYTYADSRSLGIDATFWYQFTPEPFDLIGVQLTPDTALTRSAYSSLPNTFTGPSNFERGLIVINECPIRPTDLDCTGARLPGVDLSGMLFTGAQLSESVLIKAVLDGAQFLRGSDSVTDVSRSDLRSSTGRSANFTAAFLRASDFRDSDYRSAKFRQANMTSVDLRRANLARADFTGAILVNADFRGADLRGAVIKPAKYAGANFRGADLRGAVLSKGFRAFAGSSGAILD